MKRLIILGTLLLGLGSLSFMGGCSDDDNPTGTQMGDTTSAQFQYIESNFGEEIFNDFGEGIDLSFELLDAQLGIDILSPKGQPLMALQSNSDEIVINSIDSWEFTGDFWWIFTFDATFIDGLDSTFLSGIDSVQLLLGTSPLESYEGELNFDAIKARAHVLGTNSDGTEFGAHHRMDASVDEVGSDSIVTIIGTTHDTLSLSINDGEAVCDMELTESLNLNNFKLMVMAGDNDDCPYSGTITMTASIDLSCYGGGDQPGPLEQLDIEGTWVITAVVNNDGTATVTYTDGTTTWQVTDDINCS